MTKQNPPSNSDALTFSKREQLDRTGPVPDADLPFAKAKQAGKTAQAGPTTSDLPFSKRQQAGRAPGTARPRP